MIVVVIVVVTAVGIVVGIVVVTAVGIVVVTVVGIVVGIVVVTAVRIVVITVVGIVVVTVVVVVLNTVSGVFPFFFKLMVVPIVIPNIIRTTRIIKKYNPHCFNSSKMFTSRINKIFLTVYYNLQYTYNVLG